MKVKQKTKQTNKSDLFGKILFSVDLSVSYIQATVNSKRWFLFLKKNH